MTESTRKTAASANARVSTLGQTLDSQLDQLRGADASRFSVRK
jgi:hypothetical protein